MATFSYPHLDEVYNWLKEHLNDNTAIYYTIQAGNTTAAGYLGDASNPNKYTLVITNVPPNRLNSLIAWLQDCMYNLQPKTWKNVSQLQHYKESPSVSWRKVVEGAPAPKSEVEKESEQYQHYVETHVPGLSEVRAVKSKIASLIDQMISRGENKYLDYIAALKQYERWLDTGQVTPAQALNAYNEYLSLFRSYHPVKLVKPEPVAPEMTKPVVTTVFKPAKPERTTAVRTEETTESAVSKPSTTTVPEKISTTTSTPTTTTHTPTKSILSTVTEIAIPVLAVILIAHAVKHVAR